MDETENKLPDNAPDESAEPEAGQDIPEGPAPPEAEPEQKPEQAEQPAPAEAEPEQKPEQAEQPAPAEAEPEQKPEQAEQPAPAEAEPARKLEEAEQQTRTFYSVMIAYGGLQNLGYFKARTDEFVRGDICVVKTDRGLEIGEALSGAEEMDPADSIGTIGNVIRKATKSDLKKLEEVEAKAFDEEFKFCQNKIQELKLPMKLAMVEHLFGGDKVIFYFLADGRVDFRELVKELAREYRTRIEMRQIGVRDEAKLIADYEHCGREICCRSFMRTLDPVTMKMAKSQKATLDPAKISGACGRLMCCLRFEDPVYAELKDNLPKKGSILTYKGAKGEVLDITIITESVRFAELGGEIQILHRRELRGECASAGGGGKWWRDGKVAANYKPTDEDRERTLKHQQEYHAERAAMHRSQAPRPVSTRTPAAVEKKKREEREPPAPPPAKEEPQSRQHPRRRRQRGGRGRRRGGRGDEKAPGNPESAK